MAKGQQPIGSGFGAATTARDVLAGMDLTGKRAIVTGGHSGLGLATTRALAAAGAQVTIGARDVTKAQSAVSGLPRGDVLPLDLDDLESVQRFVEAILDRDVHIDMVINSAGIMACPETRVGPGWEAQFATNHLGHFALINRLRPILEGGARVISVSSAGHHISAMHWEDVQFTQGYEKWQAYDQSKTANALFAVHLDHLWKDSGVRAFSLHPGKILTPLQRYLTREEMVAAGWIDENGALADMTFKTPEQGAATQVWAATTPQLDGLGGLYCEDCDVAEIAADGDRSFRGVCRYAVDPEQAERLWNLSADLTGVGGRR